MRSVPEWIGSSDDAKVPDRVRVRIFEAHGGICYLSGRKIMSGEAWELEHKKALCNGGEHRESNMAPALVAPHKLKTKADRAEKKSIDSKRKKHLGIRKPRKITRWRRFDGSPVFASRDR
jgi:5-methylcytosine-specific restriction protein A